MTISHAASSTSATVTTGTTSAPVTYVGVAAGRIAIMSVEVRPETATFSAVSGWNNLIDRTTTGGTHSSGAGTADNGRTRLGVWYRVLDGTETGDVTVSNTGGTSTRGSMSVYSTSIGVGWETPIAVSGEDNTHAADRSVVCGGWASALAAGDFIHMSFSSDTDTNPTFTARSITQTGATFGTVNARSTMRTSAGNDSAVYTQDCSVTTGSSNAPTIGFTTATTQCGNGSAVRLREQPEQFSTEETRNFDGVDDDIQMAVGDNSSFTHGTMAIWFRRTTTGEFTTLCGFHTSAGALTTAMQVGTTDGFSWWNGSTNFDPGITVPSDRWVLAIFRKASGSTPLRVSMKDNNTGNWTHAATSSFTPHGTAPGAGGTIRFSVEGGEFWQGGIAARALWTGQLPWTADSSGDTAIEAAGLDTAIQNWADASPAPTSIWRFNQAAITTDVDDDIDSSGQTARTGTDVVTDQGPNGFDFTLSDGPATANLVPATLTLTAQPLTPQPQAVTVNLVPAILSLTGQALAPDPGQVTVNLVPAVLTLTGQALAPAPGTVTVNLVPAVLTLTGQPLSPSSASTVVNLVPATLTLTAQPLTPVPQPVTVNLVPAVLTLTGQSLTPQPGLVTVSLVPATLSLTAQEILPIPGVVTVNLVPAQLTLTAVAFVFQQLIAIRVDVTGPTRSLRNSTGPGVVGSFTGATILGIPLDGPDMLGSDIPAGPAVVLTITGPVI